MAAGGNNEIRFIENPDSWDVDASRTIVTLCRLDAKFTIVCWESANTYLELRISGKFVFHQNGDVFRLDPAQNPVEICRALNILNQRVEKWTIYKTGVLRIWFTNSIEITVYPDESEEAWVINSPQGLQIVCAPKGGLVIWRA